MSENLMNEAHKASNGNSREGWDRTYGKQCPNCLSFMEKFNIFKVWKCSVCGHELKICQ